MTVRKWICALIVLMGSFCTWNIAQALSLDGHCSNWKVGTLTDSSGMNRGDKAKAICATLGKSGDAITVFDEYNHFCMLCSREDWTPDSSSSMVKVPDVVGMKYADAAAKLKRAGLAPTVGMTFYRKSPNEAGKVIAQLTQPGNKVAPGATVVLDIAKGGKVPMPDIVGMVYEKAEQKMKAVGLKPVKKLGPHAPSQNRINTVADIGLAPPGQPISLGAVVAVTAYNSYREKTRQPAKPPNSGKIVKRDPASAFGGRKTSPPSSTGGAYKCDTGIPGVIVETSGPIYPNRKNGVAQVDQAEAKNYVCRYKAKGEKQHVAVISFFDKPPTTTDGKKWKDHMCAIYALGKGKIPVFFNQQGGVGLSETVGKENVMRFYKFHLDQITPHTISCSN